MKSFFSFYLKKLCFAMCLMVFIHSNAQLVDRIDWSKFLGQHDLVWEEIPMQWNEGAFTGNGQVGMMIYATMKENRIDFHMGRQDVTDHRGAPNKKTSMGVKGTDLYDFSRLDVGRMALFPVGKIKSASIRQDLWNAEVRGVIYTDLGEISFRAYTPYDRMMNVIEVSSTEKKNSKALDYKWQWLAGNPITPRVYAKPDHPTTLAYVPNPKPVITTDNGVSICTQALLAGGDYATAWAERKLKNRESTLYVAIANEVPAANVSAKVAVKTVKEAMASKTKTIESSHREWWHQYYKKSFITMPDTKMESFYWIQIYKMAASSRADGPALDLMGPFYKNTGWPSLWWNLNVQLTYWPFNTSNHLDIAQNFIHLIDTHFDYMVAHKSGSNLGDFAWATHNYWLYFKYKGDEEAIQNKWVPKAIKILEKYEAKMLRNDKGQIELKPMGSPEYLGFKSFKNTNYNLAILRWLLNGLIDSNVKFNTNQEGVIRWKQTLRDLIDYPVDEHGLMIGSDQSVDMSHRHYSHLLALYPLFQLNPDNPKDRALVEKSVVHWHKIENGSKLGGYAYTGAASLYAALSKGNEANKLLQRFLAGDIGRALLLPNTFYMEGNGLNPVIETPLSAAASIMELQLQSWGDKIRVFPAVPDSWQEASFQDLRAQGGFLVSASRREGKTEWVAIKSVSGQPCVLKVADWTHAIQISKGREVSIVKNSEHDFVIDLKKGESIWIAPKKIRQAEVMYITHLESEINQYGVKKGRNYSEIMEYEVPDYKY
ncbi:glycoside hydrolase family 95-like protein [Mariniflexile ostreae]|uniref:Glycoside hydrolase family 95-like protein n=1 Tax=Mariniflexile ostreae TaxID=1520892 RepID=A0ABV5FA55_9FLAO